MPPLAAQLNEAIDQQIGQCVGKWLHQIQKCLAEQMHSDYELLAPLLAHGALMGGKRLRPLLVLLSGQACGEINNDHVVIGTVVEMIHTATLLHDDVLDSAIQRRHLPTVNAKWDEKSSILLGDYLFSQAFTLSATLGSTRACRCIGQAARLVCEGELRQHFTAGNITINQQEYFDILRGKTAQLCRVSCQLGADHAGATPAVQEALAQFGEKLGIAFQVVDDYLDLWGAAESVGKTLGTDLQQAKPTLPLIRLLETHRHCLGDVQAILESPSDEGFEAMMQLLDASDAREYTLATAKRLANEAIASLDELPDTPAKQTLANIARFAVERKA